MTQSIQTATQDGDSTKSFPANILLEKWADVGFFWEGEMAVAHFERLSAQIGLDEQVLQDVLLAVSVKLQKQSGVLWLNFTVQGNLPTPCQRCLELIDIEVTGDYRLAILFDETQIEQIEDAEYVLVEELGLSGGRKMLPIKELLEDELLLALPMSPRHEDCQMPVEMVDADECEVESEDSPFAALAALKGKLN